MKIFPAALAFMLAGCPTIPESKLGDGEDGCRTFTGMNFSYSEVRSKADRERKGDSATAKRRIVCGPVMMEIDDTTKPAPAKAAP